MIGLERSMNFVTQHARERIVERYSADPTAAEWVEAFLAIVDGRSICLRVEVSGHETHLVQIGDALYPVAYSPHDAVIVTVLPRHTVAKFAKNHRHTKRERAIISKYTRINSSATGMVPRDERGRSSFESSAYETRSHPY